MCIFDANTRYYIVFVAAIMRTKRYDPWHGGVLRSHDLRWLPYASENRDGVYEQDY
jgi:hypothetical protein